MNEYIQSFLQNFFVQILAVVIGSIILVCVFYFRDKIRKVLFVSRIKPIIKKLMSTYEEKVLPEYVEITPQIKGVIKKEDLPEEPTYGYIFLPIEGGESLVADILLTNIPVVSSLKKIRLLFDENLRKTLFDYLSYRLGIESGREDLAVKFRDKAIQRSAGDYEVIEKLYEDGKLTGIVLNEALIRLRKEEGKPSISSVTEFSKLVRKLAEIDAVVIRIGKAPVNVYVDQALKEKHKGVVLLARGDFISKATDVTNELQKRGFRLFSSQELGFENPEIGTWIFLRPKEHAVSLMRVWLKREKS